jgi:hypothetical protein
MRLDVLMAVRSVLVFVWRTGFYPEFLLQELRVMKVVLCFKEKHLLLSSVAYWLSAFMSLLVCSFTFLTFYPSDGFLLNLVLMSCHWGSYDTRCSDGREECPCV